MRSWILSAGLVGVLAAGCADDPDVDLSKLTEPRPTAPETVTAPLVGDTVQVVPSAGLPPQYQEHNGPSNNNLDVVRHDGRVFMATRNAPSHFASSETRMYVFSSTDQVNWSYEHEIALGTDVREPRLLSFKGRLFLFFAKLGAHGAGFEPAGMFVTEYLGPGSWSEPAGFYHPDESFIPWRVKVLGGRAYMLSYEHGEHEYDFTGLPIDVHFLVSDDGLSWGPAGAHGPVVLHGGASETDFAFDPNGDLYAVARNEGGDETGQGAKICFAPRDDIGTWTCTHDRKKYDSPLVFEHGGRILLIGRRNLTDDGYMEIKTLDPGEGWSFDKSFFNLTRYSLTPKRCSVWQVDRATLEVRFLVDLPSRGDTCFASLLAEPGDASHPQVYNYSSPVDGPDLTWFEGQKGETRIYRSQLTLF